MNEAMQLAGFLGAQAMMEVARGKTLGPLIIFENKEGPSQFIQVEGKTPQEAAFKAEKILKDNPQGADRGVMAFDALLNLSPGQIDAVFLQARQYGPNTRPILLAVPYRHVNKPGGFAIHRPKIFAFEGEPLPELDMVAAFFRGVERHQSGGKFWQEHYDENME